MVAGAAQIDRLRNLTAFGEPLDVALRDPPGLIGKGDLVVDEVRAVQRPGHVDVEVRHRVGLEALHVGARADEPELLTTPEADPNRGALRDATLHDAARDLEHRGHATAVVVDARTLEDGVEVRADDDDLRAVPELGDHVSQDRGLALGRDIEPHRLVADRLDRVDGLVRHGDHGNVDPIGVDERRAVDLARPAARIADEQRGGSGFDRVLRLLAPQAAASDGQHDRAGRDAVEVLRLAPAPLEQLDWRGDVTACRVDQRVELVRSAEALRTDLERGTRQLGESGELDLGRLDLEPQVAEGSAA